MSHSDRLQSLRDQNKLLLQRLSAERLRAPWRVPVPPKSNDRACPAAVSSAQGRGAAHSRGNSYSNKMLEEDDVNSHRNPNLKYQARSELPGQVIETDGSQEPTEAMVSESLQRREECRAALSSLSTRRAKKQRWNVGAEDGASMELPDCLPVGEDRAIPSVQHNGSLSAGLSPGGSHTPAETLGREMSELMSEPRSITCKQLTNCGVTELFKSSTPFTKPPSAPRLRRQPELPTPGLPSTGGAGYRGSSPRHHSHFLQTHSEGPKPRSKLELPLYVDQLLAEGNDRYRGQFIRHTQKPKSIILESCDKVAKADVGHVTFLSPDEEASLRAEVQSVQPLLGYDWIAGLIDVDSPVSEKSEQYFVELQNFRRVNKEECVYQEYMVAVNRSRNPGRFPLSNPEITGQRTWRFRSRIRMSLITTVTFTSALTLTVLTVAYLQSQWNQRQPVLFVKLPNRSGRTLWRSLLTSESASPDQPCSLRTNTSHTVGKALIPVTACLCLHTVC
uniref:uncharacterized protein miip isoform X2 n=1 Tax=Pristiophorus japonicus TaxID=55135 RepID=UPI00398F4641